MMLLHMCYIVYDAIAHVLYVLVITPLPVIWRVYMHDARGRAAHEGGVHIYQPDHEEGVL